MRRLVIAVHLVWNLKPSSCFAHCIAIQLPKVTFVQHKGYGVYEGVVDLYLAITIFCTSQRGDLGLKIISVLAVF